MVSRRYVAALTGLAALALIPVAIHSYAGVRREDCAHPERLFAGGLPATARRAQAIEQRLDAERWIEGRAAASDGGSTLAYVIARSYDPKRLYYRPERVLLRHEPAGAELEWAEHDGERVPIHRLRYDVPGLTAAYLLVYGGRPVDDPYGEQLRSAPAQLLTGPWPMTLFFVSERGAPSRLEAARRRTRDWLLEGWRRYQSACR